MSSILLLKTVCHKETLSVLICVLAAWIVIDHKQIKVSSFYLLRYNAKKISGFKQPSHALASFFFIPYSLVQKCLLLKGCK